MMDGIMPIKRMRRGSASEPANEGKRDEQQLSELLSNDSNHNNVYSIGTIFLAFEIRDGDLSDQPTN
jgi:hypothetical protein